MMFGLASLVAGQNIEIKTTRLAIITFISFPFVLFQAKRDAVNSRREVRDRLPDQTMTILQRRQARENRRRDCASVRLCGDHFADPSTSEGLPKVLDPKPADSIPSKHNVALK
ncbi:MAG: hypothetical protein JJ992_29880 [Planctomycetes bacterium]|nr:hypothetical protein [Planctomycetota bacterium]